MRGPLHHQAVLIALQAMVAFGTSASPTTHHSQLTIPNGQQVHSYPPPRFDRRRVLVRRSGSHHRARVLPEPTQHRKPPLGTWVTSQTSLTPGHCIQKNGLATIIASNVFWCLLGLYFILALRAFTRRQWSARVLSARFNVSVLAVSAIMTRVVVYRSQQRPDCYPYRYNKHDVFWFLCVPSAVHAVQ